MQKWKNRIKARGVLGFMLFLLCAGGVCAEDGKLFRYDSRDRRDPLWPLVNSSGVIENYESDFLISDLNLEGIITGNDGKNIAIINGQIVREKEQVGQFIVTIIQNDIVILKDDNDIFELKLKKEE